jgi:hypothetical protein
MKANEIITKLKNGELDNPNELADYIVILSASINTGGQMELEARIDYARKWKEIREVAKTDKQADMEAMLTPEYKLKEQAMIANRTILETIRALKKKLQNLSDEYKSAQNY